MKKLDRDLGLVAVTSIACGAMLSGIFVLPSYAVSMGGPSAYLAFLLAGILFIPSALSKAEMATALPESGGDYIFIDRAFGPFFSTVTGFGTWLSLVLKSAFALAGMSAYLLVVVPVDPESARYVAAFFGGFLVLLNCYSAETSGTVQMVLVAISVFSLLLFVERGILRINRDYFTPFLKDGTLGFVGATAFVFISYAGVTKIASAAEEVKNPGKNIPRGIIISLSVMTLLYTIVALVVAGVIDPGKHGKYAPERFQDAPLAHAMSSFAGDWAIVGISIVAVLALLSMANAGILASSRYPFAMSRYDQLPVFFSTVNERFKTPVFSILLTGSVLVISILLFPVVKLAKLASVFLLLIFAIMNGAVMIFREGDIEWYNPEFHSPFYPYLQFVGIMASLILIPFLGWDAMISAIGIVGLGSGWYYFYVRKRVSRHSTLRRNRFSESNRPNLSESEQSFIEKTYPDPVVLIPFFNLHKRQIFGAQDRIERCVELFKRTHRIQVLNVHESSGAVIQTASSETNETDRALRRYVDHLKRHGGFKIHFNRMDTNYSHELVRRYISRNSVDWAILRWRRNFDGRGLFRRPSRWYNDFETNVLLVRTGSVSSASTLRPILDSFPDSEQSFVIKTADELSKSSGSSIQVNLFRNGDRRNQKRLTLMEEYFRSISSRPITMDEPIVSRSWVDTFRRYPAEETILVDQEVAEVVNRTLEDDHQATIIHPVRSSGHSKEFSKSRKSVSRLLAPDRIRLQVENILSKRALFHALARNLSEKEQPTNEIEKGFWETEKTYSTVIGDGICIPHTLTGGGSIKVGLISLDRPISYSRSEKEIELCMAICGPESKSSQIFEYVSKLEEVLSDSRIGSVLKGSQDKTEVMEILRNHNDHSTVV